jgi:hypothetical protein
MFYHTATKTYINEGTAFEIDGIQYPQNWLNLTSEEEKTAHGIVEVLVTNSPEDDRFYFVSSVQEGPTITYSNIPKDLEMLKTYCINTIDSTAYRLLLPTDWMVVKSIETKSVISVKWAEYRCSVRLVAAAAKASVLEATTVEEVKQAFNIVWPDQPEGA